MHAAQQCGADRLPHNSGHLQASGLHGLALALDVAALIGVKAAQVGVEIAVALVAPQALLIEPCGTTRRLSQGLPGWIHIQKIAAEDLVLAAEGIDQLQHQRREGRTVFPRGREKAIAHHGAHRAHSQQLGVITLTQLAGELGKGLIKNKFPVAVPFEIQGGHRDQAVPLPKPQVAWLPALPRHNTSAALQPHQP